MSCFLFASVRVAKSRTLGSKNNAEGDGQNKCGGEGGAGEGEVRELVTDRD